MNNLTNTVRTKKKEINFVNPDDIFVLATEIISNHDDTTHYRPQVVNWIYLTILANNRYHELFSGLKIGEVNRVHKITGFDSPHIIRIEPLAKYLEASGLNGICLDELMEFVVSLNITQFLRTRR